MISYYITWYVRDGENEYYTNTLFETPKAIEYTNEEKLIDLFEKILSEYYGYKVTYSDELGCYEIDKDYRLISEIRMTQVTYKQKKAITELSIAYPLQLEAQS